MATLTGKKPSESYKDLLQISNANSGIDTIERVVEDGEGTSSLLKLSTTSLDINNSGSNTFKIAGVILTASATELNYMDGVTSNVQTQLNAKGNVFSTTNNSFLVGGSVTNSIVSKTATEVRTLLGMGTGYQLDTGTSLNNIVQHGASSSADGFAHISSGKMISKTSSASKTVLGLGTSSKVTFGGLEVNSGVLLSELQLRLNSAPLTANATNDGKLFYYSELVGSTIKRHLAIIMKTSLNSYALTKIHTNSWAGLSGETP